MTVDAVWGARPARPREMMREWMVSGPPPGWAPQVSLDAGIRALIDDAFDVGKEGKLRVDRILSLKRLAIDEADRRMLAAMAPLFKLNCSTP